MGPFSSDGPLAYDNEQGEVFLGQAVTQRKSISDDTAERIDAEVRAIIERNYDIARALLEEHREMLNTMAEALAVNETLSGAQIDATTSQGTLATSASHLCESDTLPAQAQMMTALFRNRSPRRVSVKGRSSCFLSSPASFETTSTPGAAPHAQG